MVDGAGRVIFGVTRVVPWAKPPVQSKTLKNGLVVVVSEDHSSPTFGLCVSYRIGHRLEPRGRHRHCGEAACPHRVRAEYRADAVDQARGFQALVFRDDFFLGEAMRGSDLRERPRRQREAALPMVDEQEIGRVEHQNPVAMAREVRKIPLGLAARMRASSA